MCYLQRHHIPIELTSVGHVTKLGMMRRSRQDVFDGYFQQPE